MTNFVVTGNFCAPKRRASLATSKGTPSISISILPGVTGATNPSGFHLPFPIRTSAGFFVMGLSGKTRIQTCP